MGSLTGITQGFVAVGSFNADAVAPVFFSSSGFNAASGVTRNGTGDYTLNLQGEAALQKSAILVTLNEGATSGTYSAVPVGTTGVRVRTFSLTQATPPVSVAADLDFSIAIIPLPV